MDKVLQILVNAAALWVAVAIVPGLNWSGGEWWKFLLVAIAFSLINSYIKPILRILTFPISIVTLGLFLLVINALMLMFTAWLAGILDIGFHVDGFWTAVGGSIVITLATWVLDGVIGDDRR